ncbi:hypothetical protein AA14362_1606 [Acetobacter cerevisiae DSM 14362]|nr:hypothetical protein AA14362_1606 [Acetobacter cerevisiae DSM 14362]
MVYQTAPQCLSAQQRLCGTDRVYTRQRGNLKSQTALGLRVSLPQTRRDHTVRKSLRSLQTKTAQLHVSSVCQADLPIAVLLRNICQKMSLRCTHPAQRRTHTH